MNEIKIEVENRKILDEGEKKSRWHIMLHEIVLQS